jgi:hypothetical protein
MKSFADYLKQRLKEDASPTARFDIERQKVLAQYGDRWKEALQAIQAHWGKKGTGSPMDNFAQDDDSKWEKLWTLVFGQRE